MVETYTHTHREQRNVMKHVHATFHPKIKRTFMKGIILCIINKKPILLCDILIKHISPSFHYCDASRYFYSQWLLLLLNSLYC